MTSYFEIGGKVIESGVSAEPQSFQELLPLLQEEGEKLYDTIIADSKTPQSGDGRGSIFTHWVRTIAYPTQRVLEEPGSLIHPKGFGGFAVKTYVDLVGKQYEYFIKGEDPWN